MADLKAATRNKLPAKDFGLPKQRKYPEEDPSHAKDAESRASEMLHQGRITQSQYDEIVSKARKKLGESK